MAVKFSFLFVFGLQLLSGIENQRFMVPYRPRPITVSKYNFKIPTLRLPDYKPLSTVDHFNYKPFTTSLDHFNHKPIGGTSSYYISQKVVDHCNRLRQSLKDRENGIFGKLQQAENERSMKSALELRKKYLLEDSAIGNQNNETLRRTNAVIFRLSPRLVLVKGLTVENPINETTTPNSIINPETINYYLTTTTTEAVSLSTKQDDRTESLLELKERAKTFLANLVLSLKESEAFLSIGNNSTGPSTTPSVLEEDAASTPPAVALNLTSSPHYEENKLAMSKGTSCQARMLLLIIPAAFLMRYHHSCL